MHATHAHFTHCTYASAQHSMHLLHHTHAYHAPHARFSRTARTLLKHSTHVSHASFLRTASMLLVHSAHTSHTTRMLLKHSTRFLRTLLMHRTHAFHTRFSRMLLAHRHTHFTQENENKLIPAPSPETDWSHSDTNSHQITSSQACRSDPAGTNPHWKPNRPASNTLPGLTQGFLNQLSTVFWSPVPHLQHTGHLLRVSSTEP